MNNDKVKECTDWIERLWKHYEKGLFPEFRDKLIAHKEFKTVGDPLCESVLPIDRRWIDDLSEVITKLKEGCCMYFENKSSNNPLDDAKWGLKSIINRMIDKE